MRLVMADRVAKGNRRAPCQHVVVTSDRNLDGSAADLKGAAPESQSINGTEVTGLKVLLRSRFEAECR